MPGLTRLVSPDDLGIGRLFSIISEAVVVAEVTTGRVVLWNPAAEQLFGYSAAEAIGLPLEALVPDRLRPRHRAGFARYRQTGRGRLIQAGRALELPALRKNGAELTVELTLSPVEDVPVGGRYVLAIVRDVSDRVAEERVAQHLAMLVESSQDPIFGFTPAGVITSWNAGAARLYGYTAAEVVGKPVALLIPPERPDELPGLLARVRRGERIEQYETQSVRKDRRRVEVSLGISPVRDIAGRVVGAATIVHDITERKRAEEARVQLARERAARAEADLERARLRELLTGAPSAIAVLRGPEHVVEVANPAYFRLVGPRECGKPIRETLPELEGQGYFELLDRVYRTGEPHVGTESPVRVDRHRKGVLDEGIVNYILQPQRNPNGALTGILLHAVDVTEQVRARQRIEVLAAELREREEQFQGLIEATFDAVVIHQEGVILGVNEAWAVMFGYGAAETVGRSVLDFVAPESRDLVMRHIASRYVKPYEAMGLRKDGARLNIEAFAQNTRYRGRAVRIVGIRNITERKRAEEALAQRAAELARSNTELERFAYVASHDLQEPLRAVVSYLQLLERRYQGRLDERAHKYIAHAVAGGRRMQQLLADLLAYSRAGRRVEALAVADCEVILRRVLANLRAAIKETGATVTHDPLPTVAADVDQLAQLLQNLLGNALKFRGPAPPRVHVWAERREDERAWRFGVRDNGLGIAAEFHERIFGLFQRLHGQAEYPGTGLGLAICRKIVEGYGGRLWVESEPGHGSTFFFTLTDQRGAGR